MRCIRTSETRNGRCHKPWMVLTKTVLLWIICPMHNSVSAGCHESTQRSCKSQLAIYAAEWSGFKPANTLYEKNSSFFNGVFMLFLLKNSLLLGMVINSSDGWMSDNWKLPTDWCRGPSRASVRLVSQGHILTFVRSKVKSVSFFIWEREDWKRLATTRIRCSIVFEGEKRWNG